MTTMTQPYSGVVIGGSAGALEALNAVLPMLPARAMPPVVIVMHQLSSTPSLLPGLFAVRCAMPVHEAEDKLPVQPGHLYLAPPDYHLLLERDPDVRDGVRLALSVAPPVRFSRPSIDVLFESAAVAWRARVLGVLLSGANDDGARGLAVIRAAGGQTWVQSPESAAVETMPQEAIARGAADRILTLEAIGHGLARLTE
jgi:two-component system chemotaxis response regulator CheB